MPTTATRDLRIQYGAYIVGGESGTQLDGYHEVRQGFETSEIAFTAVITGSSEADFAEKCRAIERAFREPSRDLQVRLGDSELLSWRHTTNTGFDAEPEILKTGAVGDTARSRFYRIRIVIGRPADVGPQDKGIRRVTTEISYSPSRRATVRIEGTITAIGANTSKAQYDAQIATIATARLSALSSTFEVVDESIEYDTHNKVADFRRVYREVIYTQAGSSPDDTDLNEQSLTLRKIRTDSQSSETASELMRVEARYEVSVDKTATTDLETKYTGTIRAWLLARMTDVLGGNVYGIMEEEPEYDRDDNRISVRMVIIGPDTGSDTVEIHTTIEDKVQEGKVLVPAWDGNRWSKHLYQGPASYVRTLKERRTVLGLLTPNQGSARMSAFLARAREEGKHSAGGDTPSLWVHNGDATTVEHRKIGLEDDTQVDVTDIMSIVELIGYDQPASVSPEGGGGGTTTPRSAEGSSFGARDADVVASESQGGVSPNV